jgi:hypothetical protein
MMAKAIGRFLDRLRHRGAVRRWARMADRACRMDLDDLRTLRGRARDLRRYLDQVLQVAEGRLALPVIGSSTMLRPIGTDWAWRPALWREPIPVPGLASLPGKAPIADGATVFHDCPHNELTLRQIRNGGEADLAPFGLAMDVFHFDGSFLSLVLELPDEAAKGLRLRHVIRLAAIVEMEKPLEIFARLNIRHGPNLGQIVRALPLTEAMVDFDLAYTKISEKRVEKLWIDLIFKAPGMNRIFLRDVTLTRRPRAEL